MFSPQFLTFLVTGGIAGAANFGSRIAFNQVTSFSTATILAYLVGMVTAFILAKLFVFKHNKQPLKRSILFFCLVNVVAAAQTWGISMVLAYYLLPYLNVTFHPHEIAHATGIILPAFSSYFGHKYFTFRS